MSFPNIKNKKISVTSIDKPYKLIPKTPPLNVNIFLIYKINRKIIMIKIKIEIVIQFLMYLIK